MNSTKEFLGFNVISDKFIFFKVSSIVIDSEISVFSIHTFQIYFVERQILGIRYALYMAFGL